MLLDERQTQQLKDWITKKLGEDVGDAEPDILADYALALIKGDGDIAAVKQRCNENLRDFLFDGTEAFVDQVLQAVQTHAYDPDYKPPVHNGSSSAHSAKRKRAFDEHNDDGAQNGSSFGARQMKQPRRGGRGRDGTGRGGRGQQGWDAPQFAQNNGMMPQMNPQDAFAALVAMQQAMGLPALPGMDQFSGLGKQPGGNQGRRRGRCRDYDNKGFCTRGATCPYEHGAEALVVGQDRSQSSLSLESMAGPGRRGQNGTRGRGRGGQLRGGRRAEFSHAGPNQDKNITAIVVEQIPDDRFEEQTLREFFGQFGNINKVELQADKKLAILTYESYEGANAAYTSPKVIFDNRFVKVFWYKPGANSHSSPHGAARSRDGQDVEMRNTEPVIDPEEIARRQEEAQRKHEESQKQREVAQRQKLEIDAKLKAMEAERQKMAAMLSKRSMKNESMTDVDGTSNGDDSEQTKGLKAQLAKLEAEAKSLGIDPEDASNGNGWYTQSQWHGRGGFRGRGTFAPRARGGRGAWGTAASGRGGAVKRLDNRPRTVAITFPQGNYDAYDEAMRQYLLFSDNLEHATLSQHPDRTDAAMLVFEERYRAEMFMTSVRTSNQIPNIGTVEVSWMANPIAAPKAVDATSGDAGGSMDISNNNTATEVDTSYDVAETDRWD